MSACWSIEELLELYLVCRLPEAVTIIHVPIEQTAYGDYRVIDPYSDYRANGHARHDSTQAEQIEVGEGEEIELHKYVSRGQHLFAGYGSRTKTLVIGVEGRGTPAFDREEYRGRM